METPLGLLSHQSPSEQIMPVQLKPRTRDVNGRLWGPRAGDWASVQEGTIRPVYEADLDASGFGDALTPGS